MDEIDLKNALRRYVTTGAPPFPLAAKDLLAKGRQRHLLRAGIAGMGSGTMVIVTALLASTTLTSPPAVHPGLDVPGCDRAIWATGVPDIPQTEHPAATESSVAETQPTRHPSAESSGNPLENFTPTPSGVVMEETRWPSVPPTGPLPREADPAKLAVMICYVKGATNLLFPNASLAPASEPPMELISWPELDFATGWHPSYNLRAMVHQGQTRTHFAVRVTPLTLDAPTPPTDLQIRRLGNGRTAYFNSGFLRVNTAHTSIFVMHEGLLTDDEAIAFASAPELDVYA